MTLFRIISAIVAFGSAVYLILILGELSKHLGAVVRCGAYYRWFYVSAALVSIALLTHLTILDETLGLDGLGLPFLLTPAAVVVLTLAPLGLGLTICLMASWYYWRWLLTEP